MGIMDDMKAKAGDVMSNPTARKEIEKIAKEKNISIDAARDHYIQQKST